LAAGFCPAEQNVRHRRQAKSCNPFTLKQFAIGLDFIALSNQCVPMNLIVPGFSLPQTKPPSSHTALSAATPLFGFNGPGKREKAARVYYDLAMAVTADGNAQTVKRLAETWIQEGYGDIYNLSRPVYGVNWERNLLNLASTIVWRDRDGISVEENFARRAVMVSTLLDAGVNPTARSRMDGDVLDWAIVGALDYTPRQFGRPSLLDSHMKEQPDGDWATRKEQSVAQIKGMLLNGQTGLEINEGESYRFPAYLMALADGYRQWQSAESALEAEGRFHPDEKVIGAKVQTLRQEVRNSLLGRLAALFRALQGQKLALAGT
jgi:hypothetical protein